MSEWDKLWDKNKEKVHTSWHPEAYLDEWLAKVKAEGDWLQERSRLLDICSKRLNELAMKQTKAIELAYDGIRRSGDHLSLMARFIGIKDTLEAGS